MRRAPPWSHSPETPDNSLSTAEKNHLDFEVLSDRGNKVAHAYRVAYKIPKVVAEQFKGASTLANTMAMIRASFLLEPPTSSTAKA